MTERLATTPFGGARLTARNFTRQKWIAERQAALAGDAVGNETGKADKWQLLRALTEAKDYYALSDRSINVLEALLSFHQARELNGGAPIIVFPSNAELSLRTRGMSPATLRRHLAALVAAGMIFRRDSPNGKRYCRRDEKGAPEEMFGFDLAPLALMASDIYANAETERAEQRACQRLRAEITIHLRDIAKTIEAAIEERRAGDWLEFQMRLLSLSGRIGRKIDQTPLKARSKELVRLRTEVESAYLYSLSEQEMSANESNNERHIQNSNTEPPFENNGNELNTQSRATIESPHHDANSTALRKTAPAGVTLKRVLSACPQIVDYSKNGIETWAELTTVAALVRSMLGISPSAWEEARKKMGDVVAAVVIAAILERAEHIRSAGGYLRTLTQRADLGEFSVIPMLKALE